MDKQAARDKLAAALYGLDFSGAAPAWSNVSTDTKQAYREHADTILPVVREIAPVFAS